MKLQAQNQENEKLSILAEKRVLNKKQNGNGKGLHL